MNKLDILSKLIEGTMVTDRTGKTTYVPNDIDNNTARTDPNIKTAITTQGRKLKEQDLDEMARIPSKYKLSDDWREKMMDLPPKSQTNKTVKFILDFAGEHPEWQILDIAKAYGEMKGDPKFGRQQMFNPIVKDLLEPYGVITAVSGDAVSKPRNRFDKEKKELGDDNDFEQDSNDYLDQYTSKSKDSFEDEPEPELPKQQYVAPSTAKSKAAEFFFDNDRLLQKIINYQLQARAKVRRSTNENGLRDDSFYNQEKGRISSSQDKLDELIEEYVSKIKEQDFDVQRAIIEMLDYKMPGNLKNLYNKIVKSLGDIPYKPSSVEDEFDISNLEFDDEDLDDTLDEWTIKQFKYRAGILK